MKAAINHEFKGRLEIQDVDIPEISAKDILVKIHACGVCHTD